MSSINAVTFFTLVQNTPKHISAQIAIFIKTLKCVMNLKRDRFVGEHGFLLTLIIAMLHNAKVQLTTV